MSRTKTVRSAPEALVAEVGNGGGCLWCRREEPCECMSCIRDGGPILDQVTGTTGWSSYPERCMCSCGQCQAP